MKKPTEYIYPCKNNGKCRQIYFENMGFVWETFPHDYGVVHIYENSKHGDWSDRVASFKCCTKCNLPINQAEATRINGELGLSLAEVEIDDDFMELLNGIE